MYSYKKYRAVHANEEWQILFMHARLKTEQKCNSADSPANLVVQGYIDTCKVSFFLVKLIFLAKFEMQGHIDTYILSNLQQFVYASLLRVITAQVPLAELLGENWKNAKKGKGNNLVTS